MTPDHYWFFFSYTSRNASSWLDDFYEDLVEQVTGRTGEAREVAGFKDNESMDIGDDWQDHVAHALNVCKVLVAVQSPAYFGRPYCGKEWYVFRERLKRATPDGASSPPLLRPVVWWPLRQASQAPPESALEIHYRHADFGADYSDEGLFYLKKLDRKAYQRFVASFARKLVDAARTYTLPALPEMPRFKDVPDFFELARAATVSSPVTQSRVGPLTARFVFVAGRQDEIQGHGRTLEYYGTDDLREDWRPFLGDARDWVGNLARRAADDEAVDYTVLPPDEHLLERLQQAERTNTPIAIVADPWTLHLLPEYAQRVKIYSQAIANREEAQVANCSVFVPWHHEDLEASRMRASLHESLSDVLGVNETATAPFELRDSIRSRDELQREIRRALADMRARIIQSGPALRPVTPAGPIPRLTGPGEG